VSFVACRGRARRYCAGAAFALILGLATAPVAPARTRAPPSRAGELIVGVSRSAPGSVADLGVSLAPQVRLVTGDAGTARRLRTSPGVRFIEINRVFRATAVPGDAQILDRQWALGAMNVAPAWGVSGTGAVTVAILDSGMDVTHPDLAANVWRNSSPTVGDVNGFNALTHTGNVRDDYGHGTAVAGVIGAAPAVAGAGASGVAPHARLMAVKVLNAQGVGTTASVVAGMRYALSHGARVINLSLAGPDRSRALEEQIVAANHAGVAVVTSAGNQGMNLRVSPQYPASYPQRNVIGVASTTSTGALSGFSNRGGTLSMAAPGEDILTTAPGAKYEQFYGTSAAAPEVSGAVALLEATRPEATVAQVRAALEGGARRLPSLAGMVEGGELDVGAAMLRLLALPPPGCHASLSIRPLKVRVVRRGHRRPLLRWSTKGVGACRTRVVLSGRGAPQTRVLAARRRSFVVRRLPGRYRWRMVVINGRGESLGSRTGRSRVLG
jgi:subtilisin family serine protease